MTKKNSLWISVTALLGILLICSLLFNFHLSKYKETQEIGYESKLNYALSYMKLSQDNLDNVIKCLQDNSNKEEILYTLGDLQETLKSSELSFRMLDSDFNQQDASTYLMYNILYDFHGYIKSDLAHEIRTNRIELDIDSRNEIEKELEILKEDIKQLTTSYDETKLLEYSPKWIEEQWAIKLKDILNKNPEFKLHQRISMKNNL